MVRTDFYVYVYLNPQKMGTCTYGNYKFRYEPFYVGKGCDGRFRAFNLHGYQVKRKIQSLQTKGFNVPVKFIKKGMTDLDSKQLEISLIRLIGRKNLKKGPLLNLTDGGEGRLNYVYSDETKQRIRVSIKRGYEEKGTRRHREETKKQISVSLKGKPKKPFTEEHINKITAANRLKRKRKKGEFHHTEESKRKISEVGKGRFVSDETRKKKSDSMKGRIFSSEHKRRISESKKGKPMSFNNREALQKYWDSKKGKPFYRQTKRRSK